MLAGQPFTYLRIFSAWPTSVSGRGRFDRDFSAPGLRINGCSPQLVVASSSAMQRSSKSARPVWAFRNLSTGPIQLVTRLASQAVSQIRLVKRYAASRTSSPVTGSVRPLSCCGWPASIVTDVPPSSDLRTRAGAPKVRPFTSTFLLKPAEV